MNEYSNSDGIGYQCVHLGYGFGESNNIGERVLVFPHSYKL